jgi:hypothetical protein
MEIVIIDKNGWSKTEKIQKSITKVGSFSGNEIHLESKSIAPVHLQLIYSPELSSNCKLTNLSSDVLVRTQLEEYLVSAYQTMDISDGDEVELGGYRLIPKLPYQAGYVQTASLIDARLSFQDAVVRPGLVTTGQLTIMNLGDQSDCQFKVSLRGLPEDCYHIDPVPLMFPGAEEEVQVQLVQQKHYPQAGAYDLYFTITAPKHYPGEELVVKQEIYVSPVYEHKVEIIDDVVGSFKPDDPSENIPAEALNLPKVETRPVKAPAVQEPLDKLEIGTVPWQDADKEDHTVREVSTPETESVPVAEQIATEAQESVIYQEKVEETDPVGEEQREGELSGIQTAETPSRREPHQPASDIHKTTPGVVKEKKPPAQDLSRIKVVSDQFDDFWDEE